MKKIMCPNCESIIEVDDETMNVTCNECNLTFLVNDGAKAIERNYNHFKNKGYRLYSKLKFSESNECYLKCLEINPLDFDIRTKYILNLLYLNTLTHNNFNEVIPILEKEEIILNNKNTYLFLAFIKDLIQNISVFYKDMEENTIIEDSFINESYALNYFDASLNILSILNYLKDVFPLLKEKDLNLYLEDNPSFYERFNKYLDKVKLILNKDKIYNLNHKGDFKFDINNNSLIYLNLNIKDKEELVIEDERIIKPDKSFQKKVKLFYIFTITLALIGIILLILGMIFSLDILKYLSIIPLILLIINFIYFYKSNR